MDVQDLTGIIFTLVILAISVLVMLGRKSAAKEVMERLQKEKAQRRLADGTPSQTPAQYAYQQQEVAPAGMTPEEASTRQAREHYAEAVIPEISRETTGPMPGLARLPSEPVWVEEDTPAVTSLNAELAAKWGPEAPSQQIQTGPTFARFIKSDAKTAIVMNEILGPPLAEKPPR